MLLQAPRSDIEIIGSGPRESATDHLGSPPISAPNIDRTARDQQLRGCAKDLGEAP